MNIQVRGPERGTDLYFLNFEPQTQKYTNMV